MNWIDEIVPKAPPRSLTQNEVKQVERTLFEVSGCLDEFEFPEFVLEIYKELFNLDYCHLAILDQNLNINLQYLLGDGQGLLEAYRPQEKHCLFKHNVIAHPRSPVPVYINLNCWSQLSRENPLFSDVSELVSKSGVIIAGTNQYQQGIVGFRIDKKDLTEEQIIYNTILSPQLINYVYLHSKLVKYRIESKILSKELSGNCPSSICIMDSNFRILACPDDFHDCLRRYEVAWKEIVKVLTKNLMLKNKFISRTNRSMVVSVGKAPIKLVVKQLEVEGTSFYRVELKDGFSKMISGLTQREIECAKWLSKGLTSKQIAEHLRIKEDTVNKHIQNAKEKLNAKSRAHLVSKVPKTVINDELPEVF